VRGFLNQGALISVQTRAHYLVWQEVAYAINIVKKIVIFLKNFYIFLTTREILDKLQWTKVCGFCHSEYERGSKNVGR
jgi:hypothetical protein